MLVGRLRAAWIYLLGALMAAAFYLLLIDTTSAPELYVLAGVALLCGVGFVLAREQGVAEATLRPGWLVRSVRVVVQVPRDILIVCREALAQLVWPRPVRGTFRAVAFDACADTPQDTGRRALTEALGSLAPNTIVVGVDAERGLLLVHQLHHRGSPEKLDPLGLG